MAATPGPSVIGLVEPVREISLCEADEVEGCLGTPGRTTGGDEIWIWASAIVGVAALGAALDGARHDFLGVEVEAEAEGGFAGNTDEELGFDDLVGEFRLERVVASMEGVA